MDIGKKIEEVFEQIMKRPVLMDEFYELESMDQIYEFFNSISGGYTKQEFFDYISDFLDELDELDERSSNEISTDNLSNVAGGIGVSKKALAGVLASMSLFPAAPSGLYAIENDQNSTVVESKSEETPKTEENKPEEDSKTEESKSEENDDKEEKEEKKKSGFFSKVKKFIFRNKGKIALAVAGLVLAAIVIKNRKGIANWTKETIDSIKNMFSPKKDVKLAGLDEVLKAGMTEEQAREKITQLVIGDEKEMKMPNQSSSKEEFERYNAYLKVKEMRNSQVESLVARYSKESSNVSWYSKIPYFCGIAGLLGLGKHLASEASDCIKYFSSLQDWLMNLVGPYSFLSNFFRVGRVECDPVTPADSMSNMKKAFEEVKGQEKAKSQIRKSLSQIVVSRYSSFKSNETYNHGDVFYFIGPSGIGKTFMAEKLCKHKVISNDDDFYYFYPGMIDKKSSDTLIEQIFGPKMSDYDINNGKKVRSSMYSYIKDHPNGVVIFDEYDKLSDDSLDEFFRAVMDNGKVTVAQQELDCSGITFILTSNESKESLNITNGDTEREDDASITHRTHDKSFTNRLNIVEFEKLNEDDYDKIARVDLYEKLKNHYTKKEMGGVSITMGDESLKNIAGRAESYKDGARYIKKDLLGEACQVLTEFLMNNPKRSFKKFKGKTIELVYKLRDATEEESKYDAPKDVAGDGKYYVKVGDKYKRWIFEPTLKN